MFGAKFNFSSAKKLNFDVTKILLSSKGFIYSDELYNTKKIANLFCKVDLHIYYLKDTSNSSKV